MDVDTVFQTDLLRGLIAEVETISRKKYSLENTDLAPAFHVISDHIRSLAFAIADGVTPSNTDRGYILRKILRRAVRYGRTLGLKKPFLSKILPRLEASMGEDFPELQKGQERIAEILTLEEEAFLRTLERGGNLFNQVISSPKDIISGDDAFKLKDTYGFPLEEIELIAKDEHLKIDLPRFHILEEEAKEKSRNARKKTIQEFDSNFFQDYMRTHKPSEFVGYTTTTSDAHILGIIVDGKFTDSLKGEGVLLLDKTPFYAEMGGQIGDTGTLSKQGHTFHVEDTFSPYPGVIAHSGKMNSGALKKGDKVKASIDEKRRQEIANNHTATHLLHLALQEVLGSHIQQAGSLVEPTRLRFDFNHHKPLSKNELIDIEKRVNALIRGSNEVSTYELTYDEAQKRSDIKQFFGDKYGEKVRVVDVGASKELCGGTHTHSCGTIGFFKIAKESSIAAGIRRMEATTGKYAEEFVLSEEKELLNAADLLKTTPHNLVEKITFLQEENKRFLASIKEMRKDQIEKLIEKVFHSKEAFGKSFLIAQEVSLDSDEIASFALTLIEKVKSGVVALGSKKEEKAHLLIAISEDLVKQKMHAGALIKEVAPLISGGGGGKPSIAQAGGKDPSGVPKALEKIREIVKC